MSAVITGTKSCSTLAPSITKLSTLADILNALAEGLVSILAKNCARVITNISLPLFIKLIQQLAKVKLTLCAEK